MPIVSNIERRSAAYKVAKSWHEQADIARVHLDKETKQMKKLVDNKHIHVEFNMENLVLVKILSHNTSLPTYCRSVLLGGMRGHFLLLIGSSTYHTS